MHDLPESVLKAYSLHLPGECQIERLTSGLINATWKLSCNGKQFILQKVNTHVFKNPEFIDENFRSLSSHLQAYPEYLFVGPLRNDSGNTLTPDQANNTFRLFPFVANSHTINHVTTADQAFEAAAQFGKFTSMLSGLDAAKLQTTLPDFHNISLRYQQFLVSTENGNPERIKKSETLIRELKKHVGIVAEYEQIQGNPNFKLRVTHHDTKISNVLFDSHDKGLCVIDLDTVMPGYFISDVGDMMRTYLSPTTEEDTDFTRIEIREDVYKSIVNGYLLHMKETLAEEEKEKFFFAGTFLIYMQALRFATDFLNNDVYYGAKYPEHNFNRAMNQLCLLERLLEKEEVLKSSA